MHSRRLNELSISFLIEPEGPLLIKSGQENATNPTLPAMSFVRTSHPQTGQETIYLPGSSLKGVIRSHAERIIRTMVGDEDTICCDPINKDRNCGKRTKNISQPDTLYRQLCLACRIFGHTTQASHFFVSDAYPQTAITHLPVRQNVAIDRLSGGSARNALFDLEVAVTGQFQGTITLVNFELWQVGLLALVLRDINEGRLRIGFAKSRGLGQVKLAVWCLELAYPGLVQPAALDLKTHMIGVGALAPALADGYGFVPEDVQAYDTPHPVLPQSQRWFRPTVRFGGAEAQSQANQEVETAMITAVRAWAAFVQNRRAQS